MALSDALNSLAGLSVSGVLHNYGIGEAPRRISRAMLPALCVLPMIDELEKQRVSGFEELTVTGSSTVVSYYVTHLLLVCVLGSARDWDVQLTALFQAYHNAVGSNLLLDDTLFRPLRYQVLPGKVVFNGSNFMGARLIHELQIEAGTV
jgi:hypothetical protein